MNTLTINHVRAIGNSLMAQVKAQDKTSDARFEQATKDGCPDQLKKAGAVRQVCSTHKKAFKDGVSAVDHETYSQFRNAVYGDQSKTKAETIMAWVDSDKIDFTLAELEAIVAQYKAIK
mgnify:CR=1 FL=1